MHQKREATVQRHTIRLVNSYKEPSSWWERETPTHATHSDSSQQSLRYVGYDDANEEDDGFEPGVAQDDWQDEEAHAQEDSYTCDEVDEVFDLDADGRPADLQLRCQSGDATHHCSITGGYDDATGRTWEGQKAQVQYTEYTTLHIYSSYSSLYRL